MSTVREQLIELFYDNNVHCDQTIEHLVDDVVNIISTYQKGSDMNESFDKKNKA